MRGGHTIPGTNTYEYEYPGRGLSVHSNAFSSSSPMSSSMSGTSSRELKEAAARLPFYRLRFADGYVFRHKASSEQELLSIAANHYWWGEEKPTLEEVHLTIKSRRNNIFYIVEAPGFPRGPVPVDDF